MRISDWSSDVCSSDLQPIVPRGQGRKDIQRRPVIGIDADEDPIILIAPLAQRIVQHRADHIRLLPGGYEDGDAAWPRRSRKGRGRHSSVARIDNQLAPQPSTQEDHVYDEIID